MLAEVLIPQVLGNLAQPDGDLAASVEPADGADGLVEGLLGQLLRQVRVAALGQEELIDGLGVLPLNGAHIIHRGPSFHPVYPPRGGFVTAGVKKFDGTFPSNFQSGISLSNISSKERI